MQKNTSFFSKGFTYVKSFFNSKNSSGNNTQGTTQSKDQKLGQSTQSVQQKIQLFQDEEFLDKIFKKASNLIKSNIQLTKDNQLNLYGLYKQSLQGDCNRQKPSYFDFQGNYKYNAWMSYRGMNKNIAKQLYISLTVELDPSIKQKLEGSEGESNQVNKKQQALIGNSVPKPQNNYVQQYDHPYFDAMLNDEEIIPTHQLLLQMNTEPRILPLHFAIDNQKVEYVKSFLKVLKKQEIDLPDGQGMTTLQYAQLIENKEIIELLKNAIKE